MTDQPTEPTVNELYTSNFEEHVLRLQSAIKADINKNDSSIKLESNSLDFYASLPNIEQTELFNLAKEYGYEQNEEWKFIDSKITPPRLAQNKLIVFILICILKSDLEKNPHTQTIIDFMEEFAFNGYFDKSKIQGAKLREKFGPNREVIAKLMSLIQNSLTDITRSEKNDIFSNIMNAFAMNIDALDFL